MTFNELGLKEEILDAINDLGFNQPTPIQEQAIPELLGGNRDLVGLAQTGTGKTAAFGLPMIHLINFKSNKTQGIVICPTRELCLQITKDLTNYSKYIAGSNVVAVYGGASIETQERQIRKGAQIIVATPGRMLDLINREIIDLRQVAYAVLDEADEMLNMGFQEDLDAILSNTPEEKKTWLFSATMPKEVANIARKYLHDPFEITVGKKNMSAENIQHIYYVVKEKDRYPALKRIIDFYPDIFGLIFCRTRAETQRVAEHLMKDGYNCEPLHGDLSQSVRDSVMKKFRERTIQILVATDVAARGIDVNDITHVINYNLPDDIENYTHRSGRTARAGKSGLSLCILNTREVNRIRDIERQINKKFVQAKVPYGEEVCEKQLFALIDKMNKVEVNEKEISKYLPKVMEMFEGMSKEDIIKRFVSAEFNRFIEYYRNSGDLNDTRSPRESRGEGRSGNYENSSGFKRFFINVGVLDDINKGALLRNICDAANIDSKDIGRIDVKREFSFFEVKDEHVDKVFNGMKGREIDGRTVRVELAGEGGGGDGESRGPRTGKFGNKGGKGGGFGGGRNSGGGFKRSGGGGYGKDKRSGGGEGYGKDKRSGGGDGKYKSKGGYREKSRY